jgi:Xaa-Pro aminopeptidase
MGSSSHPDWSGRIERVRAELAAASLDALVVSSNTNIFYLTGFAGSAGLLVVTRDTVILILDGRYQAVARQRMQEGSALAATIEPVAARYDLSLQSVIGRLGVREAGFESAVITVATLRAWERCTPDVTWRATERVIERHREIKDAYEIAILRRGGALIDEVAAQLRDMVRPGRTERAVADDLDAAIRRAGFTRPAFDTIVASGPNSAHPHARPGDRLIGSGDLVVLDFGGVLDGYCLDLTRMAAVGPISRDAQALFDAVHAAHEAAVESVRQALDTWKVDRAARAVLEARGLGDAFLHSTGHGLGLEVHEAPRVGRADPEAPSVLEAGMVFTIEPGAYLERVGGVRVEDDVLVTDTGAELLTTASRDLVAV